MVARCFTMACWCSSTHLGEHSIEDSTEFRAAIQKVDTPFVLLAVTKCVTCWLKVRASFEVEYQAKFRALEVEKQCVAREREELEQQKTRLGFPNVCFDQHFAPFIVLML
jgi:hypothetical protein